MTTEERFIRRHDYCSSKITLKSQETFAFFVFFLCSVSVYIYVTRVTKKRTSIARTGGYFYTHRTDQIYNCDSYKC